MMNQDQTQAMQQTAIPTPEMEAQIKQWMHRIEQIYITQLRARVAQNVPGKVMATQSDKLAKLFTQAEAAFMAGNVADMEQLFEQLKHFEEPREAVAHFDQQYLQSQPQVNKMSVMGGNR